ncbi:DUF1049 domain-containing protein [Halalkalibacillus sediminis]|uniref:DUF1049 domain-containing protein n=1 Tax=Halalkalibacillus sediminis TaxID=2018042 RepID=A0A2I0QXN9_9BACI|nr:lipopolysaccharide assembly protein LapA domain-containing protein [Halalkalibacillus sediminis]PKR79094.1 DUF1049 domain-containing protein [Halalkalibacillus sediminis]
MKQQSWIIFTLVFAIIIAVFAVINVDAVEVDFLFTSANAPLILIILLSALLGGLLVTGVSFSKFYQMKRKLKTFENEKSSRDGSATYQDNKKDREKFEAEETPQDQDPTY